MLFILYFSVHNGKKPTDPLAIPLVQRGAKRKKAFKLPPLISSPDFRQMLIQKDADETAEKLRKEQRKLEMEEKRKARAQQEEQKKAKRADKKKQQEEKKRIKEIEAALRKEVRKRRLEESMKAKYRDQKTRKKRKVSRKLCDDESDTSVDENAMFLDDNSSDEYEKDCVSDESAGILDVNSKVRVDDKENRHGQENTSITVHVEGQEEEIDTDDILNQLELVSDTIEQLDEGSESSLWHAPGVDYIT